MLRRAGRLVVPAGRQATKSGRRSRRCAQCGCNYGRCPAYAQPADVGVHGALGGELCPGPGGLEQPLARPDLTGVLQQGAEQFDLSGRERHLPSAHDGLMSFGVHDEFGGGPPGRGGTIRVQAFQEVAHSGAQLTGREGAQQKLVRSELKGQQPIRRIVMGAEDENRQLRGAGITPEFFADGEPVQTGELQV